MTYLRASFLMMPMFSWRNLHPGLKVVFVIQIINRMGDFVFPFLTLYLTQVRMLDVRSAGFVVSGCLALQAIGGLSAGKLSDYHGRKPILLLYLGTSASLLAAAGFFTASVISMLLVISASFFVGAMRPVLSALIADLSNPETRRAAFTLSYWGINVGVGVGGIVAGFLFSRSIVLIFWIDAATTYVALFLLAFFVRDAALPSSHGVDHADPAQGGLIREPADAGRKSPGERWAALRAFLARKTLVRFALFFLLYDLVYAQMLFTLPLQTQNLLAGSGSIIYGMVWSVNALSVLGLTPMMLRLTRGLKPLSNIAAGMFCFAAGVFVLVFNPGPVLVLFSTLLWTLGEVLFSISCGEFVTQESPESMRGRFQAIVGFAGSLGFILSPILSGAVAGILGLAGVWVSASVIIALSGLGFLTLRGTQKTTDLR